ncbi:MAG: hypothetical protein Q9186_005894 [Xanthomendoza sp. 1 TL-2023]
MAHVKQQPDSVVPLARSKETSLVAIQEVCEPASLSEKMERWSTEKLGLHLAAPSSIHSAQSSTSDGTSTNATSSPVDQIEEKELRDQDRINIARCPVTKEFQQARDRHPILASTGCTKDFCQAGRALHTDEPRIGENRSIGVIEKEAEGFLQELHSENFFDTDSAFTDRLDAVLTEIKNGASEGILRETQQRGMIGGNWHQTAAELEFGIRRAWRNARKCIMRSHSDELKLCDLRNVISSASMASELVKSMCEAFNGGNVLPTVFVFPPRRPDSKGPMIWNHQFLEFAGYEMEDGSVLGDPNSVALTKAIIELGWEPPTSISRWDLLPLVVMADDDIPAMIEVPLELANLVEIRHPRYGAEFEKLDLKWVAFPALTRLGFDIGGVQYTAAPFIGWFMDAEIGVRDLADTFRYNALPDVAQALGLVNEKVEEGVEGLDDLPEYERLSIVSRSQQELTYAVHWSYQQAKVSMSDTFTASMKWCRYDDAFKARNGFRLPADPYWLAPPQGSIVPVWHRGGAPNYQPKPMISRHVQDPLNAWQREKEKSGLVSKKIYIRDIISLRRPDLRVRSSSNYCVPPTWEKPHTSETPWRQITPDTLRFPTSSNEMQVVQDRTISSALSVAVYFCSAGTFAEKVAMKLHDRVRDLSRSVSYLSVCPTVTSLDQLETLALRPGSIVLLVVSSTGQGEVPANGRRFIRMCDEMAGSRSNIPTTSFRYAVYGNGDSRYAATYNGAATSIEQSLRRIGGLALAGGLFQGDTAVQDTALRALSPWWAKLQPVIQDLATGSPRLRRANSEDDYGKGPVPDSKYSQTEDKALHGLRSQQLLSDYHEAGVIDVTPAFRVRYQGTYLVTLDLGCISYQDMGCIQVLPVNAPAKVRRALRALGVSGSTDIPLNLPKTQNPCYSAFLRGYIDLEMPFKNLDWLRILDSTSVTTVPVEKLASLTSLETLEHLHQMGVLPTGRELTISICLALPILHPRTYSIASSMSYAPMPRASTISHSGIKASPSQNAHHLDILVKPFPDGRFSHTSLSSPLPSRLRFRLLPSSAASILNMPATAPLTIVATGAGFAAVRCLLQRRLAATCKPSSRDESMEGGVSLFLGLKPADVHLFSGILNEAAAAGVLRRMFIVSSNDEGVRVHDRLVEDGIRERVKDMIVQESGWVFMCTNLKAARSTRDVFGEMLNNEGGIESMGERWVEEVF